MQEKKKRGREREEEAGVSFVARFSVPPSVLAKDDEAEKDAGANR